MSEVLKEIARRFIREVNQDVEYLSVIEFAEEYGLSADDVDALDMLIAQARIEVSWDD